MTHLHLPTTGGQGLARITFGEPIPDMPEVQPPYTPPRPRPGYQDGVAVLERHRQGRMATAASREDWEDYARWEEARVMPALLIREDRRHPETVPALLTELFWDDESVGGRMLAATPEGDVLSEDVTLLRVVGAQYVAFTPVIAAR